MKKQSGKQMADTAVKMLKAEAKEKGMKKTKTLDATPDWTSLVPMFIEWIQSGNSEQHLQASESIMQMARVSDAYRKNKSLFEASGDMLEVLKKAEGFIDSLWDVDAKGSQSSKVLSSIRKVIAKAEGASK